MKKIVLLISALAVGVWLTACGSEGKNKEVIDRQHELMSSSYSSSAESAPDPEKTDPSSAAPEMIESETVMELSAGNKTFQVSLEENETVSALKKLLPAQLEMSELNGNEKYHYLDKSLPSAPAKVGTITKGDVMLYEDNCLVIFYKSFSSSYSYTKIGHIKDTSELEQALGEGSVKVGFSLKTVKVQSANNKFDFAKKTVTLNSGYEMPLLGLGTWTLDDATAENSVYTAIKDGYRLIDTAQYYGNEKGVGSGLKKAISEGIVKREDVFITIKSIADAHGKTPAQVILRWHLQAGYVTIPGSKDPDHILENISIFDFELSAEEMKKMLELNTGKRYENW